MVPCPNCEGTGIVSSSSDVDADSDAGTEFPAGIGCIFDFFHVLLLVGLLIWIVAGSGPFLRTSVAHCPF